MAEQDDFQDYMDSINRAKLWQEAQSSSHEQWKRSTLLGKITQTIYRLGDLAFVRAIIDAMSDQQGGKSPQARVLSLFVMISAVIMVVAITFAIGRVMQMVVGTEIMMEQEVVIVEEVKLSDLEKLKKKSSDKKSGDQIDSKKKRRDARDKKMKSS